jgi:hypothetical protein
MINQPASWITFAFLAAGGAGLFGLLVGNWWAERRYREIKTHFICPVHKKDVEVAMVRDRRTGDYTGVRSCSAFANPENVTCNMACVAYANDAVLAKDVVLGKAKS